MIIHPGGSGKTLQKKCRKAFNTAKTGTEGTQKKSYIIAKDKNISYGYQHYQQLFQQSIFVGAAMNSVKTGKKCRSRKPGQVTKKIQKSVYITTDQ
ncbi:MAG: hypothetical protein IKH34_04860 [Oscillospiraceae bacterium]|nr:hypothetical protein [Oscillospiraceae bacterium]